MVATHGKYHALQARVIPPATSIVICRVSGELACTCCDMHGHCILVLISYNAGAQIELCVDSIKYGNLVKNMSIVATRP